IFTYSLSFTLVALDLTIGGKNANLTYLDKKSIINDILSKGGSMSPPMLWLSCSPYPGGRYFLCYTLFEL
ncbi:hypothetical protein, partial [Ligilactobacillus acidipiscis]|uniref:hypothetical protein n=1 Tax=Ligilactobacillus acidipiscis TaxID=89059 RepID=UPI000A676B89